MAHQIVLRRKKTVSWSEMQVTIGNNQPVFIVADIGSNWKSLKDCLHSIPMAKQAGADAVKFQLYNLKSLYGYDFTPSDIDSTILPHGWLPKLKEKADACDIEFMCSAFSPELAQVVNPFVNIHKVASAELTHVRLLETLRDFSKPVFLSTGGRALGKSPGQPNDIDRAIDVLQSVPTFLLYCVSAYPAQAVNLQQIQQMSGDYSLDVGFSDHTTDFNTTPVEACALGACIIEKHMTDIPETETPDRRHSLDVGQFKYMVDRIRSSTTSPGPIGKQEEAMRLRHNRRLIVTKNIKQGAVFQENVNFGIYRSLKDDTKGLSPWAIATVHGQSAIKDMRQGESIGPQDFT